MRISRISLADFRGVDNLDVEFDIAGVTIAEGRNEIGKTSIADAFMLLLDEKDSSNKQIIRDAQPVGRDVGPFVEAELTAGPYRLTYRKQWLKNRKSELEIHEPSPEQLTGEAAHSRMCEILEAETDTALFKALRYHQGNAISQAAIGESPTLAAALDAAAGGTGTAAAGADALFARVEAERQRYFTPVGRLTGERTRKIEQVGVLGAEVSDVERRLRELDDAVERHRQIQSDLAELQTQSLSVTGQIDESLKAVQAVEEVERRVETARHENERAESALREAATSHNARKSYVEAATSAARTLDGLEAEIASAASGLGGATAAVNEAKEARDGAKEELASAENAATDLKTVVELLDLRLERDQLRERYDRVIGADETITEAERFLSGCAVDEVLVREIDSAAEKAAVARAHAEADKPRVVIEALQPIHVEVDGRSLDIVPGAPLEETVSTEVAVVIGDVARVSVSRQQSIGDVEDGLESALEELGKLLQSGCASSPEEARELVRERARRETERDNARRRREEDLRDLDLPALAAKVERAEERLGVLEADGDEAAIDAMTLDDARTLLQDSEVQVQLARERDTQCETALEAAQSALRVFEDRDIEQRTRLETATAEVERAGRELEEQRASASDAELDRAVVAAEELSAVTSETLVAVEHDLAVGDPETARALLDNARQLQTRLSENIHAREVEIAGIQAHLDLGGHEGLADRLAESRARLEDLERDVDSGNRRAAAVERLHEILNEMREKAQQAYVGPFREKLNAYSRILYGPDADVAVDHSTLEIVSRTLQGTTIPFQGLSGGTREQLAVLARLACAALVSPASEDGVPGGVPVVIDDALGYSDPGRLEALGAALSVAGRDCQVIVLTCEPSRYRGVGGAKVVSLG